ncbi:FtsH protease activity modulator HflK [Rhodomicrobium sp. R_RK_3]|uniref:FtsH protease activity modulator HflK n=1 Tax=Rhodomicrobium sp. R_RK_3 TaxID=2029567 RepID=UPI000B4BCC64|nr:FtsH protease activity modulator HflK [Rhodomicrobium sp. R_RK_3]
MPWSSQNGGGGGGGWKGGGGPWGQGPTGGGQSPDLEELLKRSQDRLKQAMPGGGLGGGFLALILIVAIAAIGFYSFTVSVQPNQEGVVLRFGKLNRILTPGLKFRWPYPIETVYVPPVTNVNRAEVGLRLAANTSIFSTSGEIAARDVPEESLMLTGDENIVDVDFIVLWKIKDAAQFLFNIQKPEGTVKDVAESAMREIVGQNNIQPILTKSRRETEDSVKALMQKTLDSYGAGIEITQVQMQKVDPPAEVIASFRDVQAARADQERLQNEADSYANRVIPEARGDAQRILQAAEGYKEQTVAEANGRADRFLDVYEEYAKAPAVTRKRMYLETMERILGGTDKVIIDNNNGQGQGVVPYLPLNELNRAPQRAGGGQ